MVKIKVYTASKLCEAGRWRDLRKEWTEVEFVARWPFYHVDNIPDNHPTYASLFWEQDLEDVTRADVVLIYAEPEHKLRGALVEAGMAIALGRRVIVVGNHDDYGTWSYHPLVSRIGTMDGARLILRMIAT